MQKNLFIGIDFSKNKFDVTILNSIEQRSFPQETFENDLQGYINLLKWVGKQSNIKRENWLFCGKHTGLYSRGLSNFLFKKNLIMWLENPLQIKSCLGIKRGKSDRLDSLCIAQYSIRFIDKLVVYKPDSKEIDALRQLFSFRSRQVKMRVALEISANETRRVISRDQTSRYVFEESQREIERLNKRIATIEKKMYETIMNSELKRNYQLICSIKGVGMMTAIDIIIHTNNFVSFENARQLACYCGCAPFPNESGTINKGSHISRLANSDLKVLLTQCARSAAQFNPELRAYYLRKKAEGKTDKVVINNLRNKLIQRIFAIIKSGIPYMANYINPFENVA